MPKLAIFFPVILLMFTAVLYQSMAIASYGDSYLDDTVYVTNSSTMGGGLIENSTSTSVEMEGYALTVGWDASTGFFALIVGAIAISVICGIQVVGSGLTDFTVRFIVYVCIYYGFWMFISLFALEAFELMPLSLGWIVYLFLSVFYSFGVLEAV